MIPHSNAEFFSDHFFIISLKNSGTIIMIIIISLVISVSKFSNNIY